MLGRKGRRITQLEAKAAECDSHGQFIPIAQEIVTEAAEFAAALEQQGDPHQIFDAILARVSQKEERHVFTNLFNSLPAATRLEVLETRFGDPEISHALEVERQRLVEMDDIQKNIQRLQQECRDFSRVNLSNVPEGSKLKVSLHDKRDFLNYKSPDVLAKKTVTDRTVIGVSLGEGRFQVLSDIYSGLARERGLWATPTFEEHEVVAMGGALGEESPMAHAVYYGSGLSIEGVEGDNKKRYTLDMAYNSQNGKGILPLGIAYVAVNGEEVMGPSYLISHTSAIY